MRLINVHTRELKEFIADPPDYAILSHRWRNDEEVSFQDFQDKRQREEKGGDRKIHALCQQAQQDGLNWVWIDTCCIDKSSSAELSEAINSMFTWYRDSNVCYAYLDDVTDIRGDRGLTTSEWFKRGWTLQELIAPDHLNFYCRSDSGWRHLGDKRSLAKMLSVRTRIDVSLLEGHDTPNQFNVARRMSWAAGRRTTRKEDMAYSLMGLFDINMPMLYGEGAKAFLRLQEQIVAQVNDHTIFAWQNPAARPGERFGMFAVSPDDFALSSDLVSLQDNSMASQIDITANGLRAKMTACPTMAQVTNQVKVNRTWLLLPLNCRLPRSSQRVGVRAAVVLFWHDSNRYERRQYSSLLEVSEADICRDTTIFINRFESSVQTPRFSLPDRSPCEIYIQLPDAGITLLRAFGADGCYYDYSRSTLSLSLDPYQIMSAGKNFVFGLAFDVGNLAIALLAIELSLVVMQDRPTHVESAEARHRMMVHALRAEGDKEFIHDAWRQKFSGFDACQAAHRVSIQDIAIDRPDRYNPDQLYVSLRKVDQTRGNMYFFLMLSFKGSYSWRIRSEVGQGIEKRSMDH